MTIAALAEILNQLILAGIGGAEVRVLDDEGVWGFGVQLDEQPETAGVAHFVLLLDVTDTSDTIHDENFPRPPGPPRG